MRYTLAAKRCASPGGITHGIVIRVNKIALYPSKLLRDSICNVLTTEKKGSLCRGIEVVANAGTPGLLQQYKSIKPTIVHLKLTYLT